MIELKKISKSFALNRKKQLIIPEQNLKIQAGEFLAIKGPSGSGKSTLLHLISGLERPDSGEVWINNQNILNFNSAESAKFRNQEIGFIFQNFFLHPNLTAAENIEMAGIFGNKKHSSSTTLLRELGLSKRANHYPHQLSGGEQQRVAIGRALFHQPKIILADEPTGNLDFQTANEVMTLLKKIHQNNQSTMIIVTHDENIAKAANRIINIKNGHIQS